MAIFIEKEFTNIFNGIKNSLPLEEKMSFSKEDVDFVDKYEDWEANLT